MKILLLQPPVQDFYDTDVRLQPLGLACLKAALGRRLPDVGVEVRDYHQGWGRRTVPVPPELGYLAEYYPAPDRSPFSTFHGYYHFGATFETLAAEVAEARPDLVGISSLFSAYHREVLRSAEAIKARRPVPVVVGGTHASAVPESLLAHPAVDYVVRGEGERPLVELVRALRGGAALGTVPNLGFRRGAEVVLNPLEPNYPLDELPPPDFSDLPPARYRLGARPLATLVTSRGCPRHCSFCSARVTTGAGYRRRPVADVLAEVRTRHAQGYRALDFEDDNLTAGPEEARELFEGLIREYPSGELSLQAMNGVSYLDLDPDLLALMARAGFTDLNLSLVTLDPGTSRRAGRPSSPERFGAVVAAAQGLGLRTVAYQILGFPGEAVESMVGTLVFLARLPVLLGASPFYLPPGAPLAGAIAEWPEADLVRCRLTALGPAGGRDAVYTLFVAARLLNFLKGLALPGPEASLTQALAAARASGPRGRLGAEGLEGLLAGEGLRAAARTGSVPLRRFRPELFRALWTRLGWVTTRDGVRIRVGGEPPAP